MSSRPERTLLEAVRILHRAGYNSLRVHAYRYATGHWRCELGRLGTPIRGDGDVFGYSSSLQWDFFRDGNQEALTADQVAQSMIEHRDLSQTRSPAIAYAVWFSALLDYAGPEGIFIMSDDCGYDAARVGYVELGSYPEPSGLRSALGPRFPLSPTF